MSVATCVLTSVLPMVYGDDWFSLVSDQITCALLDDGAYALSMFRSTLMPYVEPSAERKINTH